MNSPGKKRELYPAASGYFFAAGIVIAMAMFSPLGCKKFPPASIHFKSSFPPSAMLLHYQREQAGFDVSYAFVFRVTDNRWRDQIIADWQLQTVGDKDKELRTFISLRPPVWWPAKRLQSMPERYERDDESTERYWSLWVDRDKQLLYCERGRW